MRKTKIFKDDLIMPSNYVLGKNILIKSIINLDIQQFIQFLNYNNFIQTTNNNMNIFHIMTKLAPSREDNERGNKLIKFYSELINVFAGFFASLSINQREYIDQMLHFKDNDGDTPLSISNRINNGLFDNVVDIIENNYAF